MISLFLILQWVYVLKFYKYSSPAIVDIVLDELKSTITFEKISPNYLLGLYKPGLSL